MRICKNKIIYYKLTMDSDPNDLLSTNTFISEPILEDVVPEQFNEEFRQYYKAELEKKNIQKVQSKIDLRSVSVDENTDSFNLLNTNQFSTEKTDVITENGFEKEIRRIKKDKRTIINIDSRSRNKILYPNASNFEISLGYSFYNVRQVRLVSIEFPNTHAVINETNNYIYWKNQEDIDEGIIDPNTFQHPVYKVKLRTGSYISSTLQNEISSKMNSVKRRNNDGINHYFIVTLDIDTDIVTFLSLKVQQLIGVNLVKVVLNSPVIEISSNNNHGYEDGDNVYIIGATTVGGIPASSINGFHIINVIDPQTFTYEADLRATEGAVGGGNNLRAGISAPFQFLYGEYPKTVSQNIGYPLENSNELIQNYIRDIKKYYLLQLTTQNANFSIYDEQKQLIIKNTYNTILDTTFTIINVINENKILIEATEALYNNILIEQYDNDLGQGSVVNSIIHDSDNSNDSVITGNINLNFSTTISDINGVNITLASLGTIRNGFWIRITSLTSPAKNLVRRIIAIDTANSKITLNAPFSTDPSKIPAIGDSVYIYFAFNTQIMSSTPDNKTLYLLNLDDATDFKGFWIKAFVNNEQHAREIIDYNAVNKTITLSSPLNRTPQPNDKIIFYSAPNIVYDNIDTFSGVFLITSLTDYSLNTAKCTFDIKHNYTSQDIGKDILFIDTKCTPSIDGYNTLRGIIDEYSIYVNASVTTNALYSVFNTFVGSIPYEKNILQTHTYKFTNVLTSADVLIQYGLENCTYFEIDYDNTVDKGYSYLREGDKILIQNLVTTPPTSGIFTIVHRPYLDTLSFIIEHYTSYVNLDSLENAYAGTDIITMTCPNHRFNFITGMTNVGKVVTITTLEDHNLSVGQKIITRNTGLSYLDVIGENDLFYHTVITKINNKSFTIEADLPDNYNINANLNSDKYGYFGIIGVSNNFRLYNCKSVGGIESVNLNNIQFTVYDTLNKDQFLFKVPNSYATSSVIDGNNNIYISSDNHGFRGTHTNAKNNVLSRSINLEGENYSLLCCPQLGTVLNTGPVKNIFAKIILDQSPGAVVFNFLSNPKTFENVPLKNLDTLSLSMLNYDGSYYIFNDLDYSLTLEITEVIDTVDNFNISSRRGITDIKPANKFD